jgi:hypothetical protein
VTDPPGHATAHVVNRYSHPTCSECQRKVKDWDQWRCPWVSCRAWLRGTLDPAPTVPNRKQKETRK